MIKTTFKHLDALRGIMATYVSIVHFAVLFYLNKNNKLEFNDMRFFGVVQLGQVFMTVFFVLSGFLITYILLLEKEKYNKVNFKKFYLRRAFRILPLYYIAVFGMFYLYKNACLKPDISNIDLCSSLYERTMYYIFMVPNWAHAVDKTLPHISNYWSIGAEEQFYILWPIIIYFTDNYLKVFFRIFVMYCLILIIAYAFRLSFIDNKLLVQIVRFLDYTRFGAFAFGGIVSYFVLHHKDEILQQILAFITKKSTQVLCLIVPFIITLIPNEYVAFLKHIVVIPCCAVIIYNMAMNEDVILKIDQRFLNYLGKITYSLYILNQIVIDFVIKICFAAHFKNPYKIFIVTMFILFVSSAISYELIEKPFMKLRRRFG